MSSAPNFPPLSARSAATIAKAGAPLPGPAAAELKPAATAAAGWTPGAGHSWRFTTAAIDRGPQTSRRALLPPGYTAQTTRVATGTVKSDGFHKLERVTVRGPTGKSVELQTGAGEGIAQGRVASVGTAGKYVSLREDSLSFGTLLNQSRLVTFDVNTGKAVKLEQLVRRGDFEALVKQVSAGLTQLGAAGEKFGGPGLRERINTHFALSTDVKTGKTIIDIALPQQGDPRVAHFSMPAPDGMPTR